MDINPNEIVTAEGNSAPDTAAYDNEPCEMCEQYEDCTACEGSGEDMYGYGYEGCYDCGGSGQVIPDHCCDCGGSPYCQCCSTCGNYAGRCGCPVTVTLADGTTKAL